MVEPEHHQRVGVGENAFVDRQLVAGLVDALENGDQDGPLARLLDPRGCVQRVADQRDLCSVGLALGVGHRAHIAHPFAAEAEPSGMAKSSGAISPVALSRAQPVAGGMRAGPVRPDGCSAAHRVAEVRCVMEPSGPTDLEASHPVAGVVLDGAVRTDRA